MRYIDERGRVLFVADGISGGRFWATYYRKPSGALKRLVSKYLPERDSRHGLRPTFGIVESGVAID